MSAFAERLAPAAYTGLLYATAPVLGPAFLIKGLLTGKYLAALPERLGLARAAPALERARGGVWVHAVSVGEVLAAGTLLRHLRRSPSGRVPARFALSSTTLTGLALARAAAASGEVEAAFASPLDFPGAVRRAFRRLEPRAVILLEAEFWPNWLREAARRGVPVAVVNARVSERSFVRYHAARALFRPLFASLAAAGARGEEDARRLIALGVVPERIAVTGDLKFDAAPPRLDRAGARANLCLPSAAFVWVAGSTLDGEHAAVLDAFRALRRARPDAVLVLAPRKSFDVPEAQAADLAVVRRTQRAAVTPGSVLLLDTIGELRDAYAAGDVAFVGGSLVPAGGHNLLEPAAAGVAVLFGPSTQNFAVPAERLLAAGGGRRVADGRALADAVVALARDDGALRAMGERALAVVAAGRGAVERTAALVTSVLGG